ncbi:MAG TPA: hypothetical protein VG942_15780 [Hyphomonadaceae bacterium]|nr:hypothetical protein [Hyphomonadaceae bacterium]
MTHEDELARVREKVSMLAEQVGTLLDVLRRQADQGLDTTLAEEKLELLEALMWKLHRRQVRLQKCSPTIH